MSNSSPLVLDLSVLYIILDQNVEVPADKAVVMLNPEIGDNEVIIEGELVVI